MGQLDEAVVHCQQALKLKPDFANAYCNLANAQHDLGLIEEAFINYRRALELKPDSAFAHNNLAVALRENGQIDEAMASFSQALTLKPDFAEAYGNLANAQHYLGLVEVAVINYRRALELKPDFAAAHFNFSTALLSMGQYVEGWSEFEWRWATPHLLKSRCEFTQPQWQGEAAKGKTLLIYAEQGFGDTVQFCRYASLCAARGLRVILVVPPPLVRLLRSLQGVDQIIAAGETLPNFDLHCPMLSLPLAFKTTLDTIPSAASYLQAEPSQIEAWRLRLAALPNKGLRIGIVWAGNPRSDLPHLPHLAAVDRRRSVALEQIEPLLNLSGFQFFSLQKDSSSELDNLNLTDYMCEMRDFADTAALIANLDLVISVDTAVAHLAAALGKPVWLLNRFDSCWRWLRKREDSPWYPSLKIFRQPKLGDWPTVIENVTEALSLLQGDNPSDPQGNGGNFDLTLQQFHEKYVIPTLAEINQLERLIQLKNYAEIESLARLMIEKYPAYGFVWRVLGAALLEQQKDALLVFEKLTQLLPEDAEAHFNHGNALREHKQLTEATASYRRACEIKPDYFEAFYNLGNIMREVGQLHDALACYIKTLEIKPDFVEAHYNLANTLKDLKQYDDAIEFYVRTLEIKPDYAEAHCNLGTVLEDLGRLDEAAASYRRALKFKPDFFPCYSNLLFVLNYKANATPSYYLEEARQFGRMAAQKVNAPFSHSPTLIQSNRLRVGMVSGDLLNHPVGYFLEGFLSHINSARIELIAYSTNNKEDELTARIRPFFAGWKDISDQSDAEAAQLIYTDSLHILLDLSGHTRHNRLPLFAWKPAPKQACWLGYFATTGMDEMDYFIADKVSVPEDQQVQFTESISYLPDTRLCFTEPHFNLPVASLPALSTGMITLGCFQNLSKISDDVLAVWGEIMTALPNVTLRMQCRQLSEQAQAEHMLQRLEQHKIDPVRVALHGAVPREAYLAAHAEVDFILDTFPYPGGTTTCEALWMGVPTLTLAGDRLLARQGASLLMAAGLEEWVATNREDYVAKAIAFAADLPKLAALRNRLRQQVLPSPVFDAQRFARNFEDALWGMCGF